MAGSDQENAVTYRWARIRYAARLTRELLTDKYGSRSEPRKRRHQILLIKQSLREAVTAEGCDD